MTCKPRKGLKPCLTFYPTNDWELAFHIYIEKEFTAPNKPHYKKFSLP